MRFCGLWAVWLLLGSLLLSGIGGRGGCGGKQGDRIRWVDPVLLVVHQDLVTTEGQWHQEIADPR